METTPTDDILVWLPSPMGDAILCTPALRAIRKRFDSAKITFFSSSVVRAALSPCGFADEWLQKDDGGVFSAAKTLRGRGFTQAILFKNSFGSALACFLARIPVRIGYAREGRGILLTDRLHPPRLASGDFKPISMVDYYLAVAFRLGADVQDRHIELSIEPKDAETAKAKLPQVFTRQGGPVVILVPGAAGPSKRWPADRFAQLADRLAANFNATVVLSVAPNTEERQIAEQIVKAASHRLVNLGDTAISLGELKSLYSIADLVICNDTGPRHIAIGLKRRVITLVGPNNPEWTDPGYCDEVFIKGVADCSPCDRGVCKKASHFCMEAISIATVYETAARLLTAKGVKRKTADGSVRAVATTFYVDPACKTGFEKLGLTSIETVFAFQAGKNLTKNNLAPHRSRVEFQIESPPATFFLKRYDHPPIMTQLKNWLSAKKRISFGLVEFETACNLVSSGISAPRVVAWGQEFGMLFEKRSFVILEKIPGGESLERKLPVCFNDPATPENLKMRRQLTGELAAFIKKFHDTGYRHRDLYFSHIFRTADGRFFLIDLARTVKTKLHRYLVKDLAQLNYSAPPRVFTNTDRMRFFTAYLGRLKLIPQDKGFIKSVIRKTRRIANHDSKKTGNRAAQ
jgi:heptosyltransferase-2